LVAELRRPSRLGSGRGRGDWADRNRGAVGAEKSHGGPLAIVSLGIVDRDLPVGEFAVGTAIDGVIRPKRRDLDQDVVGKALQDGKLSNELCLAVDLGDKRKSPGLKSDRAALGIDLDAVVERAGITRHARRGEGRRGAGGILFGDHGVPAEWHLSRLAE